MNLPSFMIWMSFRYCLGRRSVAPGMWVDWAEKNWKQIPRRDRDRIATELEQEFKRDDDARERNWELLPLGTYVDRTTWNRIRLLIEREKGE